MWREALRGCHLCDDTCICLLRDCAVFEAQVKLTSSGQYQACTLRPRARTRRKARMAMAASPKKKPRVVTTTISSATGLGVGESQVPSRPLNIAVAPPQILTKHHPVIAIKDLKLGKTDVSIMGRVTYVSLPHVTKSGTSTVHMCIIICFSSNIDFNTMSVLMIYNFHAQHQLFRFDVRSPQIFSFIWLASREI